MAFTFKYVGFRSNGRKNSPTKLLLDVIELNILPSPFSSLKLCASFYTNYLNFLSLENLLYFTLLLNLVSRLFKNVVFGNFLSLLTEIHFSRNCFLSIKFIFLLKYLKFTKWQKKHNSVFLALFDKIKKKIFFTVFEMFYFY